MSLSGPVADEFGYIILRAMSEGTDMTQTESEPAFPLAELLHSGMSLRDYFAAKAMQAFLCNTDMPRVMTKDMIAENSFLMADRMLEQRSK
jgi:hypothetical protein